MDPIVKVDESRIRTRAHQAVAAVDVEALGALLGEIDAQRQQYFAQAQEEARCANEAAQGQAAQRGRLAYLDPPEALKARVEQQFNIELRTERATACQQQGEALGKLLTSVRKESERLHAQRLAREVAEEAKRLQDELAAAKAGLEPLRRVVEKIIGLIRQAGSFNVQSETAKIPAPTLTGDPGIVNALQHLALTIPAELQRLAGGAQDAA